MVIGTPLIGLIRKIDLSLLDGIGGAICQILKIEPIPQTTKFEVHQPLQRQAAPT